MSAITRKEVEHVANLARLQLTEEEAERYTKDLNAILDFAAKLNELDTSSVEPTSHATDVKNVMREDVNRPSLPIAEVLKNAPDHEDGQFKVPAVFE